VRTRLTAEDERIIAAQEKMVGEAARRYLTPDNRLEDLEQIARVGVVEAALLFEPDRGVKFSTFAWRRAEGALQHHRRWAEWPVRVDMRKRGTNAQGEPIRRKRYHAVPLEEGSAVDGQAVMEAVESQLDLARIFARLSHRDRVLLWLRYVRGLTYVEIAGRIAVLRPDLCKGERMGWKSARRAVARAFRHAQAAAA
jgi:RNA polymerase sigma factor (sigma-70 family)